LQNAAEELRLQGVEVTEVRADLATRDDVKQFWDQVVSMKRNIDVACINAGVGVGGVFWETDLDAELNMVYLNCAGTIQLAKYVVQHMLSRNEGRILFTASIAGEMVAPREAVYAATKAFDCPSRTVFGMNYAIQASPLPHYSRDQPNRILPPSRNGQH
jgi:uncharacterized protein